MLCFCVPGALLYLGCTLSHLWKRPHLHVGNSPTARLSLLRSLQVCPNGQGNVIVALKCAVKIELRDQQAPVWVPLLSIVCFILS
jgi:hypothetical protein